MISFKQYLLSEGGNVRVTDIHGIEYGADKINLSTMDRSEIRDRFIDFFKTLNKSFKAESGELIWKNESILTSGKVFNGSSEAFFNRDIKDDEFKLVKNTVGDIDITVPHELKKSLWEYLNSIQGKSITRYISFIGHNRSTFSERNAQVNSLVEYKDGDITIRVQIDFEFLPYDSSNAPDEFSKFSHSSHWDDLKEGLKGVHHKYLLRAIAGGSSLRKDIQVITRKTGKPQSNPDGVTFNKFSVDKGLRVGAYTPVMKDGKHVQMNDKPVYHEVPTSDSIYTTDVLQIARHMFGYSVPEQELKIGIVSFLGLVKLMKKYMSKDQIKATLDRMIDLYWGKGAQGFERADPELDLKIKTTGWSVLQKAFPFYNKSLDSILETYYSNYKITEVGV